VETQAENRAHRIGGIIGEKPALSADIVDGVATLACAGWACRRCCTPWAAEAAQRTLGRCARLMKARGTVPPPIHAR